MWRNSSKELAALKQEHERLRWTLSDMYQRESERETACMSYQYGTTPAGPRLALGRTSDVIARCQPRR